MKWIFVFALCSSFSFAQQLEAFKLYNSAGKPVSFEKMMKDLGSKDVILFGEFHDNPISHWLELEVLLKLNAMKPSATIGLGFEMFELHQKQALSDYISNQNYKQLKDTTTLWPNFKTDYKPALDSAIHFGNTAFAANITRKYARLVFKNGLVALDTLSAEEKQLIAPLPFPFDSTLSQYAELIKMGKEMHQSGINFALAQAIKDATMAHSIATQLKSTSTVLFLNGAYHSDFHQGIEWYLKQYTPNTRVGTISTVSQKELKQLDKSHHNRADYILVVNQNMGSTH
jgi:uncharacterized iron-regulated protein